MCLCIIRIFILINFSFDARATDFEKGSHWLDEKSLGSRAYFQASATPPSLIINDAQDSDSGIYRCRVDFQKSPTKNSRVQLKIIRKSHLIYRLHILIKINDSSLWNRFFFLDFLLAFFFFHNLLISTHGSPLNRQIFSNFQWTFVFFIYLNILLVFWFALETGIFYPGITY